MTNSLQQNSSTIIGQINAELSEVERTSQENEKLLLSLFNNLNNLNDELIKLDHLVEKTLRGKRP
jgi:methyl-accepting chemotaxis protein